MRLRSRSRTPRPPRPRRASLLLALAAPVLAACAAPAATTADTDRPWSAIAEEARGQTVSLWMWGGDPQGNAYVDDVLAPAAAELGVTLRRVPVADTGDAVNRVLAERQAGRTDGDVDLVWVNGDNFRTGRQADAWLCGWTDALPNLALTDPEDPLLLSDFGVPVDGCEAPWHKAQFTLVYDASRVPDPPTTLEGVLQWAEDNPGRFTYPAPPDFTGSVFVRQVLYSVAGGPGQVPATYDQAAYDELAPQLWQRLRDLAPSLWRGGATYPRDVAALDRLFAQGQVDMTMTYGPATLTELVEQGTFPPSTRVLTLEEGTVGNASFLAIPATTADSAGAMVVADLALSPEQQAAKADPATWGQFTVLDLERLSPPERRRFAELPESAVVPPYAELSRGADPELAADWVGPLDDGWRRDVLAATR
ncbi:ABC transporter substrate-binding protein [Nocardioides coralli]|uniref:ABC transporter substrate-binding protein n=1 Tax=Nocardioides coralli TaxID=2872154 RepID=UPI001CA44922|nr:ABC transporter substrate-binding protein [Nocardioides coralli]QZY30130.1 ABC transporter substrate-binding protein [Nocardioides coralli]